MRRYDLPFLLSSLPELGCWDGVVSVSMGGAGAWEGLVGERILTTLMTTQIGSTLDG